MASRFLRTGLGAVAVGALLSLTVKATSHPCPDINGDHLVNVDDLLAVIIAWGPCPADQPCTANVGGNSGANDVVDVDDLLYVIEHWGECTDS